MSNPQMANPALAGVEVEEISRSSFIAKGALAMGAIYGTTLVSPFVKRALAQGGGGDLEILNFALTLEYLEAAFYDQAKADTKLSSDNAALVDLILGHENEHVAALTGAIKDGGGTPVEAPGVDFGNAFASEESFLELAQTFEDTGVSAYNGAGPAIKDKALLGTAGSIVQIEARHASAIRLARGESPTAAAFDETLTVDEVLAAVDPFVTK